MGLGLDDARLVGCQPKGANSLEVSLRQGAERAVELPRIESVAASTAETIADDQALAAIRESSGDALSVTDEEILAATRELGREGLCVEASSALPVACLSRIVESHRFDPGDPLVCVLTSAGIKWPEHLDLGGPPIDEVKNDAGFLDAYLAGFEHDGDARR
jgi:threonine synthase